MSGQQAQNVHITGIIQGVGFRPYIYNLAIQHKITGWVRNTSAGVDIHAEGTDSAIASFIELITANPPPLALIDNLHNEQTELVGFSEFEITASEPIPGAFQPISPDVCICQDCLAELFDPQDHRYRYPFINCTNCGPRLTIIEDIPYDRPNTTMASFHLCEYCQREYTDPTNRRFHAQPVACPECGPHIWLEYPDSNNLELAADIEQIRGEAALEISQKLLQQGKIIAVKGLGGFHLACDATNPLAVSELRRRKLRVEKPFALMMADLNSVERHCQLSDNEKEILLARERPIVILERTADSTIAQEVAPHQNTVGVMLPYTPLHYLLFAGQNARLASDTLSDIVLPPLVMTSGNLSEEPIATDNQEARFRLASLADAFLMHNRPINTRCDDSVTRAHPQIPGAGEIGNPKIEKPILLRRARGYAPSPILVHFESPPLLATGPELKNTFCLLRGRYALLSQHIGDLENYETLNSFEQGILHYQQLFRIQPELIAYDLHPNYLATRYALERGERESIPLVGVQHHHAHVAAAMVEHGIKTGEEVIGIAFDGTGFGEDGSIWGGEFLVASYERYQRWAHLAYMPLPGGDAAIRKPARIALAYLWNADLEWDLNLPPVNSLSGEEKAVLRSMLENNMNIVQTSSIGRLFDAVSALLGIRQVVNYEGQAAIELEAVVDPTEDGCYQCEILNPGISSTPLSDSRITDTGSIIRQIHADVLTGSAIPTIAARFHNTLAKLVLDVCQEIRIEQGIQKVVLSGGVWQNMTLLEKTLKLLFKYDFQVYTHRRVPPNDGCIALGQAAIAFHRSHGIMS